MSGLDSLLEYNEIVRQMFGNKEEGFQFYNNYAKEKGFSVRRSYCEWDNGHNEITLRKFVCSHEGFREEKELKRESKKRKPWNITRVGCRAKLSDCTRSEHRAVVCEGFHRWTQPSDGGTRRCLCAAFT